MTLSRFNHSATIIFIFWLLIQSFGARAAVINGSFNVVETWTVTLNYTGWGDENRYTVVTKSGTSTGTVTIVDGRFQCIDKSGIPGGAPNDYGGRTLSESNGTYSLRGGRVMPILGAGSTLFGIVYMGAFIIKVDLIDGEVPIFYRTESYSGSGPN